MLPGQQESGSAREEVKRMKVTNTRGILVLYKEVRNLRGRPNACCREDREPVTVGTVG